MVVSVHALFSKNDLIGSRLISCGTKHLSPSINNTPSHTALLVNNRWVHESTGHSGVRVISYDKWKEINKEVDRVYLFDKEYQEIADEYRKIKDKDYDYLGVVFLGICIFLSLFRFKIPNKNPLENSNKYYCCEVLGYLTNEDYDMMAPNQILALLYKKYGKIN